MEKITLVCTSLNPDETLLNKMIESAKGFDSIIVHIDGEGFRFPLDSLGRTPSYSNRMSIPKAYNLIIDELVNTEWICCFCDDDYFYTDGLFQMIHEVHKGIDADVAHFKFHISGHRPIQDARSWIFGEEYNLCEKQPITPKLLEKHNRLPAGSFFRKSAWEKVNGFRGDKFHDWDLWKRMTKNNCTFKYFDYLVYNLVRRENSAWVRQQNIK